MSSVVGWGVWVSKPEYMVDAEYFWKSDGNDFEDVMVYAKTLEDIFKYYVTVTECFDLEDSLMGYHEVAISQKRRN